MKSVYSAVRTGSLNKSSLPFVFKRLVTPVTCCGADLSQLLCQLLRTIVSFICAFLELY